ncbi:g4384 [Coccomyxa viridis]|uniref:G4384 protein n=1 Tax=Coccomyxa viridis TaxID=1274662 RepID=A0ABP1FQ54_9CHLO
MATQPTINELFGSDSEDEEEQIDAQAPEASEQPVSEAWPEGAGELEDEDAPERGKARNINTGEPQYQEAVLRKRIGSKDLRLVRLSNLLNINAKPFDSATFEPAADIVYTDARGKPRVILPDYNCIRFRNVTNPDGTTTVKSNARFVRWSDGSLQLLIGEEVLDVSEVDTSSDHGYLYSRPKQATLLECEGHFGKKMVFRPATLNSRHHKRLTQAVERHHVKVQRVQKTTTTEDPAKAKAEREKREEERIRATHQLEKKQTKALRGSRRPEVTFEARSARPGGVLNTAYLEAMDNDEYESESDDEGPSQRDNLRRRTLDDEAEAERRLAEAKRPTPLPPSSKRALDSLDSDEEGSISEEEEAGGRGPSQQAQKRRHVVLSDDEDDS